jgi:hypothetical protein
MKQFYKGDIVKVTDTQNFASSRKKPRVIEWVGRVVGPSVFATGWYLVREVAKKGRTASAAPHTVPWTDMEVTLPWTGIHLELPRKEEEASEDEVAALMQFLAKRKTKR